MLNAQVPSTPFGSLSTHLLSLIQLGRSIYTTTAMLSTLQAALIMHITY